MAELHGFDANQVQPNEAREALPAGEYDVAVTASEAYVTKSGNMQGLKLEMQVLNGPHQNRKVFDRINFRAVPGKTLAENEQKAVQIGAGNLSALCRAINVLTPKDSSELHGKAFRVKVAIRNSDEYGQQNEVKAYKSRTAGPASSIHASQPQPAGAATETPW